MNLVLYDQMRVSIEQCAHIDEVAGIKDKAERIQYYARIRDDKETEANFAEIRLRAIIRIGELSQQLEKVELTGPSSVRIPSDGKPKGQTLTEAGLSTSTAQRYEEIAGPREEKVKQAVSEAHEKYFAEQREKQEPATLEGLKATTRSTLVEKFGEPSKRPKAAPPIDDEGYGAFSAGIHSVITYGKDVPTIVKHQMKVFAVRDVRMAREAIRILDQYVKLVIERFPNGTYSETNT